MSCASRAILTRLFRRVGVEGLHVVEPVHELHYDDPYVLAMAKMNLRKFRPPVLLLSNVILVLQEAIDKRGYLGPKVPLSFDVVRGILDGIVQKPDRDGGDVHAQIRQHGGHFDGMRKIRLPERRVCPRAPWPRTRTPFMTSISADGLYAATLSSMSSSLVFPLPILLIYPKADYFATMTA